MTARGVQCDFGRGAGFEEVSAVLWTAGNMDIVNGDKTSVDLALMQIPVAAPLRFVVEYYDAQGNPTDTETVSIAAP